jgi:hypothetical protein
MHGVCASALGLTWGRVVPLTASQDLGAVEVRVVPELETFVTTNPTSFTSIPAGQMTSVNITIAAPADAVPSTVEGTIQIRNAGRPPRNFARPLPVEVTISPIPLPPDPGEAGKATLEGIDSDNDGVRDDIQRYIVLTYPESERTRAALVQSAHSIQEALVKADDVGASIQVGHARARAVACLIHVRGPEETVEIFGNFRAQVLNTDERSRAYI